LEIARLPYEREKREWKRGPSHESNDRKAGADLLSVAPKTDRRKTMKSGTRDEAEGKWHQIKGKIKEVAGKLNDDPELEAEGTNEKIAGNVQEKVGQVKKVVGK
jgi:uncharacterized protein YjbJ (UPF0337 family)